MEGRSLAFKILRKFIVTMTPITACILSPEWSRGMQVYSSEEFDTLPTLVCVCCSDLIINKCMVHWLNTSFYLSRQIRL